MKYSRTRERLTEGHHCGSLKPGYAGVGLPQLGLRQQYQEVPEVAVAHKAVLLCPQRPAATLARFTPGSTAAADSSEGLMMCT